MRNRPANDAAARFKSEIWMRRLAIAAVLVLALLPDAAAPALGQLLQPAGTAGQFRPNLLTTLGNRLLFDRFDASGNSKEIVSVDPASGRSAVVAANLHQPVILFSDARRTVVAEPYLENGPEVVVSNSPTGEQLNRLRIERMPDTATIVGQELRLGSTRKEFPPRLAIDIIDLSTNRQLAAHENWNVPDHSRPVFWNGRIVLVAPGVITFYDERLEKIASAPSVTDRIHARSYCGVIDPRVFASRLIYQTSCGRIVVFDLERRAVVHEFDRFDPSRHLALDLAGDLLFAVPIDDERKPRNGAVFDLAAGRRVAVLPLTADAIAVRDDMLAALAPRDVKDTSAPRSIALYRVNRDELSESAQDRALQGARTAARAVLARTGSFEDALDTIESVATDRLRDVGGLDPTLRAIALDRAAWLSATLDRRAEAIGVLERLLAAAPDDAVAKRRLGAALLRDHLLSGAQASLERARALLADRPELLPAQPIAAPSARAAPIDFGVFSNRIVFWRDKMIIGRWRSSNEPTTLMVYDRATLQPLWSRDIPQAAPGSEEEIEGLTFEGDRILAWMTARGHDGGRVAVIDAASRRLTMRPVRSAFEIVLQTPKGVLGCGWILGKQCALVDPRTFKASAPFDCDAMGLAGRDAADQEALGLLLASRCQSVRGRLVALSSHWMLKSEGVWPGPFAVSYRRLQDGAPWQSSDLGLTREGDARIPAAAELAIIDNPRPALHRFIRLDFATGAHRSLFQVGDPDMAGVAWAATDQVLLVGSGRNLVLYDLANGRMAGVLQNIVGEDFRDNGHGVDRARIVRLLVDGARIIVLTFDGSYSRVLQMRDVLDHAGRTGPIFQAVDAMLRE